MKVYKDQLLIATQNDFNSEINNIKSQTNNRQNIECFEKRIISKKNRSDSVYEYDSDQSKEINTNINRIPSKKKQNELSINENNDKTKNDDNYIQTEDIRGQNQISLNIINNDNNMNTTIPISLENVIDTILNKNDVQNIEKINDIEINTETIDDELIDNLMNMVNKSNKDNLTKSNSTINSETKIVNNINVSSSYSESVSFQSSKKNYNNDNNQNSETYISNNDLFNEIMDKYNNIINSEDNNTQVNQSQKLDTPIMDENLQVNQSHNRIPIVLNINDLLNNSITNEANDLETSNQDISSILDTQNIEVSEQDKPKQFTEEELNKKSLESIKKIAKTKKVQLTYKGRPKNKNILINDILAISK